MPLTFSLIQHEPVRSLMKESAHPTWSGSMPSSSSLLLSMGRLTLLNADLTSIKRAPVTFFLSRPAAYGS